MRQSLQGPGEMHHATGILTIGEDKTTVYCPREDLQDVLCFNFDCVIGVDAHSREAVEKFMLSSYDEATCGAQDQDYVVILPSLHSLRLFDNPGAFFVRSLALCCRVHCSTL